MLQQVGRYVVVLRHIEYVVALRLRAHNVYVASRVSLAVVRLRHYLYALVGSSQLFQHAQTVIGRAVIERNELPVGLGLRHHRANRSLQVQAAVVDGH